jgi:hypothetical protein
MNPDTLQGIYDLFNQNQATHEFLGARIIEVAAAGAGALIILSLIALVAFAVAFSRLKKLEIRFNEMSAAPPRQGPGKNQNGG